MTVEEVMEVDVRVMVEEVEAVGGGGDGAVSKATLATI